MRCNLKLFTRIGFIVYAEGYAKELKYIAVFGGIYFYYILIYFESVKCNEMNTHFSHCHKHF